MLLILQPSAANGLESFGKKPLYNEDVSQILDQKLNQYDQPRRTLKSSNSNFSLNYNKNYGKISRLGAVQNPMMEQQSRLNDFKSFNRGPRGSEDFYGFSMKIPLQPK
jgi:hypothetical protein